MLRRQQTDKDAQIFTEYVIVIGVILLSLMAMSTMFKRAVQGMVKVVADEVGLQENSDQRFDEKGYMKNTYVSKRDVMDKKTIETPRVVGYVFDDSHAKQSSAYINLGWTAEN